VSFPELNITLMTNDQWEEDNSHTRSLQALQAFMIGLDIGLWSGFKRKMEIAQSFAQPIIIVRPIQFSNV
jgi:hypothetical protein